MILVKVAQTSRRTSHRRATLPQLGSKNTLQRQVKIQPRHGGTHTIAQQHRGVILPLLGCNETIKILKEEAN